MIAKSAETQLEEFIDKYTPEIAALARASFGVLRARLPGAVVLVYDNYNALAIGFGPTERSSEAVLSIALFPRWVSLFFLQGAGLDDPQGLLKGGGKQVRHLVLESTATLNRPPVRSLIALAVKSAPKPFARKGPGRIVIKSISAKQRPRRPK